MISRAQSWLQQAREDPAIIRAALRSDNALLAYLALIDFVAHMLVANNYGYFRDELYYLEDGKHLAFGYVDQAPLIGWLAGLTNFLFHDSLVGIHLIPAIAGAGVVFVTGLMARELGGGRFAQFLAALGSLATLFYLATASIFSMDILDTLWWTLGAYVLIRLLKTQEPTFWLWFGLVAGLGLFTKLTMLFFGFGVVVGLLLTPQRVLLRSRWPWLGGLIAFAFLLPYILWNAANGWPTVTFWHHYGGLSGGGPLGFLANQLFAVNPFNLPLIIAGFIFYFRAPAGKSYRALGWIYVVLYVLLTLINAKAYFLAPIYPILYAGGAIVLAGVAQQRAWLRPAYSALLIASALYLAPVAMPVLPPTAYVQYYSYLTSTGNGGAGQQNAGQFPQYLGDRFGWDTMTATVANVYHSLPADEQAQACIFTQNYGEASAMRLLGPQYHLPPVISGHNNFYYWGPGTCNGRVIITVGLSQSDDAQSFASVTPAATIACQYCMESEFQAPVFICTQPKADLKHAWAASRHFD